VLAGFCEGEMDFFQSRDDLQIWTMAQGGSAGAEALREVRSPDGNLHWQVLKIIRDSSRLFEILRDYSAVRLSSCSLSKKAMETELLFSIWTLLMTSPQREEPLDWQLHAG